MLTSTELLITARDIVRRTLAADLGESPLYVISPREGSLLDQQTLGSREGLYLDGADAMFKSELQRAGLWAGPGVAVIVDTGAKAAADLDDHDRLRWLVGLILHELAHWLDRPLRKPVEVGPADAIVALTKTKIALKMPRDDVFDATAAYRVHGRSFTRLAVHAWHRACTIGGLPLGIQWLSIGSMYPGLYLLDQPYAYVEALYDELAEYPLDRILRPLNSCYDLFDEPPAYAELWRAADERIAMFARRLSPETEKPTRAPIHR